MDIPVIASALRSSVASDFHSGTRIIAMTSVQRGTKRNCHNCKGKYYDLGKVEPVCPMCGIIYKSEALLKSRGGSQVTPSTPKKIPQSSQLIDNDRLSPVIDDNEDVSISSVEPTEANDDEFDEIDLLDVA